MANPRVQVHDYPFRLLKNVTINEFIANFLRDLSAVQQLCRLTHEITAQNTCEQVVLAKTSHRERLAALGADLPSNANWKVEEAC